MSPLHGYRYHYGYGFGYGISGTLANKLVQLPRVIAYTTRATRHSTSIKVQLQRQLASCATEFQHSFWPAKLLQWQTRETDELGGREKGEKFYFNLRGHERLRTSAAYLIAQIHLNTHTQADTHKGRQKHIQADTHTHTQLDCVIFGFGYAHIWISVEQLADCACACVWECVCACATRPKQFLANYTALPSIVANLCACVCVLPLLPQVGGIRNSFAHVAQRLLCQ